MRYIDHSGCRRLLEPGECMEVRRLGALTRKATRIAEKNKLGVLRNRQGAYRIITEAGLGAYEDFLFSLEEVDAFFKNLANHADTRY